MCAAQQLETQRLSLERVGFWDVPFLVRLTGDKGVRRYLGGPRPFLSRVRQALVLACRSSATHHWIVRDKRSRRRIGLIELTPHKDGADVELSYQFHPVACGYGFATEAAKRVLKHALGELELPRVIAETQAVNEASRKLLSRVDMREVQHVQRFGALQVIYATG